MRCRPPTIYDRDLRRIFSDDPRHYRAPAASTFLRHHRARIRHMVAHWTGEYQLTLDSVLDEMIDRCRELKLRAAGTERQLVDRLHRAADREDRAFALQPVAAAVVRAMKSSCASWCCCIPT